MNELFLKIINMSISASWLVLAVLILRFLSFLKYILFLADRTALVKQAKNNYSNLLPDLCFC